MVEKQKDGRGEEQRIGRIAAIPLSGLISLLTGLLLSLPASLLLFASDDPGALIRPAALLFGMLCHLVCGFTFRRLSGLPALLSGVLSGAMLLALFFGISLLLPETRESEAVSAAFGWAMRCVGVIFSLFGSILAANAPKRHRRGKHRRRRRPVRR